jgi:hypothetical protein
VNVLALYHDLKARDVILEADGENLKVSAPAGVLTEEDREGLRKFKPMLLRLSRAAERAQVTRRRRPPLRLPGAVGIPATQPSTTP